MSGWGNDSVTGDTKRLASANLHLSNLLNEATGKLEGSERRLDAALKSLALLTAERDEFKLKLEQIRYVLNK